MKATEKREQRIQVIKNTHLVVIILYSMALAFTCFGMIATPISEIKDQYIIVSIILSILLVLHFVARGLWTDNPRVAKALSGILGFLLLLGFPLGTVLGLIILFKLFKLVEHSPENVDVV